MIQSVERAAAILRVLGSGTPRLGVTEIAGRVGLPKPTVYGLLRTLVNQDLVAQDPDTGKYSLGAGVLQLGNAFLDGSEVRARSLLWAEALAQRANESVWVATLSGSRVIVLHHVFRPDNTVQILEVGAAIPWHACALGHAIVANLPPPEAARAMAGDLTPLTGRTKTTKAALGQALAQGCLRRLGPQAGLCGGGPGGDGRRCGDSGAHREPGGRHRRFDRPGRASRTIAGVGRGGRTGPRRRGVRPVRLQGSWRGPRRWIRAVRTQLSS
jgi:DNA-binding IclR family transcriptional regulator